MVLTIASLITLAILEVSGWSKGGLTNNYFVSMDFSNITVAEASGLSNSTELTTALDKAIKDNVLDKEYRVYLWSYCTSTKTDGAMEWCSKKQSGFVFDPVDKFQLNSTTATPTGTSSSDNAIESTINSAKDSAQDKWDEILGDSASGAMKVYKKVAKWNFWAYQIAFWTTVVTVVVGLVAICSRWGSLCTWIFASVSSFPVPRKHNCRINSNIVLDLHHIHLPRQSDHHYHVLNPYRCPQDTP